MENRTIAIIALSIIALGAGGFLAANFLFMSSTSSNLNDTADSSTNAACEQTLTSKTQIMRQGETSEIPESCFQNGNLITDRLSNADPGDSFRKTSDGIETVE